MENQPIAIVVKNFNKFNCTNRSNVKADNLFRSGYWNVFKYSQELENFLKNNLIEYKVVMNYTDLK